MNALQYSITYDMWVVMLSYLIATFASYVTLDLAARVRTPDRAIALGWGIAGSITMGTGIWAMHFVGMLAIKLPFAVGYDYLITALSWVIAVGVSALALGIASAQRLTPLSLGAGALAMGAGISAMHYMGMHALKLVPEVRWDPAWVALSVAIAVGASAAALLIFFYMRRLKGRRAVCGQIVAALVMGAAIAGMHYAGMAAAGFPGEAVCLTENQLQGDRLGLIVSLASIALLTVTLFTSILDARLQSRTAQLAASLREANEELQQIAFRDALTGLPNRSLFDDRVAQAVERCRRDGGGLAVMFVDLDGFKPINDSFGHGVGDAVLREVAQRLAEQARATDTIARVGGDEFVMLIEGNPDVSATALVAQRVIDTLQRPFEMDGRGLRLSCSVGVAMYPTDGPQEQLMAHADSAMYAAKRSGGSSFAFFEPHMNAGVREQVELLRDLRAALDLGGQLELHYQPKVRASSGTVLTGVEALVRWRHPVRGLIPPGVFIPVAERFGLIGALGSWVIDEGCRQLAEWREEGFSLPMAINLSVHQLRQEDLVERVGRALKTYAIEPALLTFEVTESVAMDDAEGTMKAFERLRALGVRMSIDDFGTGYSSLSYLRQLAASQLKIDRSFVQDLETSSDARAIVEAVVQLAHALGLEVVAEGVETDGQRQVLQKLRCDKLQGFLFARPMPAEALHAWATEVGRAEGLRFTPSAFAETAEI